ncbi:hypothetical protein IW261DRAFT_1346218, partial [Armillaria novae-zelandiae]
GHGHIPDRVKLTQPGDLAIKCMACPCPGVTLPEGWKSEPQNEQWVYFRYIYCPIFALDTNFHMSNIKKSTEENDPGLHTGLAYFIDHDKYIQHVCKYASQKDISTCSSFQTLQHSKTRNTHGLRTMGVEMCVCTCHEHVVPLTVGDLQVSEIYCNMNYMAGSAIKSFDDALQIFFLYNVACQWKVKLCNQMMKLPSHAHISDDMALDFGIPKLHCKGHKQACQCQYSMNLHQGLGCTCGEGIKHTWDNMNPCAASMKEMGLGTHHNTIDNQFGGHNWRKQTCLGEQSDCM